MKAANKLIRMKEAEKYEVGRTMNDNKDLVTSLMT